MKYARNRRGIVTLEDHSIVGGLGTRVCEAVAEAGLGVRVLRHGIKDCFGESGDPADLYEKHELNVEGITRVVERFYNM